MRTLDNSAQHPRNVRRGSVYMLVLGMGTMLTVIGLSVAVAGRVNIRTAAASHNADEAAVLASTAVDLAFATINSDTNWRETRGCDTWNPAVTLGHGSLVWKQTDEIDCDIENNPDQQVRLYGEATVGSSARRFSILASPRGTQPLSVLSCPLHSETSISIGAGFTSSGGAVSSDGTLTNTSSITGNVEAGSVVNTGSIVGFVTTPSRNKSVPGIDVFTEYEGRATAISYWSLSGGDIDSTILSSSANSYGPKSASGIYFIQVPTGQRLRIRNSIIQATLVIQLQGTAQLVVRDLVAWEPPSSGLPALIASGTSSASVVITPESGTVDVPLLGANILGIIIVIGSRGTAPSELHGLYHVMGATPTTFSQTPRLIGTWISDGPITVSGKSQFVADPNLVTTPPHGYTAVDATVTAVPGSFRWEER